MFRPRSLIWLALIGGIGYLVWRWRQNQVAALPAPATPAPLSLTRDTATPPTTANASADAPSSGPRRIATRVHRGAPPAMPLPPLPTVKGNETEEPPAPPTEPPAVVEQTLAPISAEEAVAAPAEPEPPAAHEQTLAPISAEEIGVADEAPAPGETLGAAAEQTPVGLVNINTAELQALIDLPGIGRALATRIIAYREQNGPFDTVDRLIDVQGIGSNNINEFRHLVTV
jgi:competence protein ComEA